MSDNLNSSLSLHQLLQDVDDAIRSQMPSTVWVRAEILNIRHSGYWALELSSYEDGKKAKATAMIWQSQAAVVSKFEQAAGTRLAKGLKILIRVDVGFHSEYGLRLTVREFDPAFSLGDMEARLQAIRTRLIELGEHDLNRTLPAPREFTRVAVVSPEAAAGLGDFRTQADALQQYGLCEFTYFPAVFQGERNEETIIAALKQVVETHREEPFDAVAIIRGGGDKAGLYELNKQRIARGVCRMPVPVLAGIGHDRDSTILDELAHRSFPTPSLVIAHIMSTVIDNARGATRHYLGVQKQTGALLELAHHECKGFNERLLRYGFERLTQAREQVTRAHHAIRTGPLDRLQAANRDIEALHATLLRDAHRRGSSMRALVTSDHQILRHNAHAVLGNVRQQNRRLLVNLQTGAKEITLRERHALTQLQHRMLAETRAGLQTARHQVETFATVIKHLDPQKVLARGFALVFGDDGQLFSTVGKTSPGTGVIIKLQDGTISATTDSVTIDSQAKAAPASHRRKPGSSARQRGAPGMKPGKPGNE